MKIKNIEWRNFGSYGNKLQKIEFDSQQGNFFLIVGANGAGKCLDKDSQIDIMFDNDEQKERFKIFLKNKRPI
jgi:ABC-type cobalamin/Fe3+-siderophores transport system ATPase subunit